MSHEPQHPDSPCSPNLSETERAPAKIWELLRRNYTFKKTVAHLIELDGLVRATANAKGGGSYEARVRADHLIKAVEEHNTFAAVALQWLVPEPLFEIRHVAVSPGANSTGRQALVTVKLQEGTTADPEDKQHWRTFEARGKFNAQSIANFSGRLWRRGPDIRFQTSEDPRLRDQIDAVKEWRDYFANGRTFTLDTPWRDSPPQFKRSFCWLWRRQDSRESNPLTGDRIDAPHEHETRLFDGWDLMSRLGQSPVREEDLARALTFGNLAKHYRVFAFPKSIRSRMEARRMGTWLTEQLSRLSDGSNLPAHEPVIYGTPLQWDVFLFAGQCNDKSLLNAYRLAKPKVKAIERKRKWRRERLNYIEHYRAIQRHIERIFLSSSCVEF